MSDDLRSALRLFHREPGLAAVAVLTVALGVGANTAIFSVVNGVLLRPLPYPDPDRLVTVNEVVPAVAKQYPTLPVNAVHYLWWRKHARSFSHVAAAGLGSVTLTGTGEPERLDSARITPNFLDTLGVRTVMGRTFAEREGEPGRDQVALISHALWSRRFGSDPRIAGRVVQIDSTPCTIVGVMPQWFRLPVGGAGQLGSAGARHRPDVIRPLAFSADELKELMGRFNHTAIARLRPGVTDRAAESELNVIAGQLEENAGEKIGLRAAVAPMQEAMVGKSRKALVLLLAAAGAVLLIACLNLANLFLARAERQWTELAVRVALGASAWRMMGHAMAEALALALAGGALGVAAAAAALQTILRNAPVDLSRVEGIGLDVTVPWERYREKTDRDRFHERVLATLAAQPGVLAAGITTALPLTGETWIDSITAVGDSRTSWERPSTNVRFISGDYFRAMGIPLLRGRTFSDNDRKRKVTVISERLAQTLWPGQDAVGKQVDRNGTPFEVVGVVGDVRAQADKAAPPMMYRPHWEWSPLRVKLVARSAGDPQAIAGAVRAAVRGTDPEVPIREFVTVQELLDDSVGQRRFQTLLAGGFACIALLLAAVGIYGVVAYSVARRRSEMGLRMALGARPSDVYAMVISQGLRPVLIGAAAGICAALAGGRVLTSLLYEVSPQDPAITAEVTFVIFAVAIGACFIPARRAARIAPMEALRTE